MTKLFTAQAAALGLAVLVTLTTLGGLGAVANLEVAHADAAAASVVVQADHAVHRAQG